MDSPIAIVMWLHHSTSARLLVQLAPPPISHTVLDNLPPSNALHYIRDLLVTTGIRSRRDEHLERVTGFTDHLLAGVPAGHAAVIKPYTPDTQQEFVRLTHTPALGLSHDRLVVRFDREWLTTAGLAFVGALTLDGLPVAAIRDCGGGNGTILDDRNGTSPAWPTTCPRVASGAYHPPCCGCSTRSSTNTTRPPRSPTRQVAHRWSSS